MTANRSAKSTTPMDTQITLFGTALVASWHTAAGAHIGGYRVPPTRRAVTDGNEGPPVGCLRGQCRSLRDRLPGCEFEYFGMGPAVVLGQDLSEGAGPVAEGAVADLAAGDRKPGNGRREAAGR